MKIFKDRNNEYYSSFAKKAGNAITVIENNKSYFYEFIILNEEASIKYSSLDYINEACEFYHEHNKYIYKYKATDNSFLEEFDRVFTFKLPISCLQPSCFFLDEDRLNEIEESFDDDKICIPVAIINDEYVALDGHHRLYMMMQNYSKLVNVYIDTYKPEVLDFIYIAKEQNIRSIKQMHVLTHDEYKELWEGFLKDYHKTK